MLRIFANNNLTYTYIVVCMIQIYKHCINITLKTVYLFFNVFLITVLILVDHI